MFVEITDMYPASGNRSMYLFYLFLLKRTIFVNMLANNSNDIIQKMFLQSVPLET